jgi:hypothetical protein
MESGVEFIIYLYLARRRANGDIKKFMEFCPWKISSNKELWKAMFHGK